MESASHSSPAWRRWFGWWIEHRGLAAGLCALLLGLGVYVAPFELPGPDELRDPLAVDAIPDLAEHQQIVFTQWPGQSPRDVEDQISYPLSSALLGTPGVRSVRSSSAFGFSSIYVIFEDDLDFYWARARLTESLAALPGDLLPQGVVPRLGPDATALGQVFWYTLQGRDAKGQVTGGWRLDELRSVQDWTIRPALRAVPGVSEVASIGGFVREFQVDVDPLALAAHGLTLAQVANAVRQSNQDTGARTLELNRVEYVVRGVGRLEGLSDLEQTVVVARDHTPIRIADVAKVHLGPAQRRGALDDGGAPAVGGVVVARYKAHPTAVIPGVKAKLAQIQAGLPSKTLADGRISQLTVEPFYDRTTLIEETLGTMFTALSQELLITVLVVLWMLGSFRAAGLVSAMLPLGVAGTLVAMKLAAVQANIMALLGIAIAIGTMVDLGIVFVENISRRLHEADPDAKASETVVHAASEVAPAVLTSVLTTIVSFLPVLGLSSTELRVFSPLVLTKTFAMLAALCLALVVVPCASMVWLGDKGRGRLSQPLGARLRLAVLAGIGVLLWTMGQALGAWLLGGALFCGLLARLWPSLGEQALGRWAWLSSLLVGLVWIWTPLGLGAGTFLNLLFVAALLGAWLGLLTILERRYTQILGWALEHRRHFLLLPAGLCAFALVAWVGVSPLLSRLPDSVAQSAVGRSLQRSFPGLGRDYLPSFDEGAFLYMPSTTAHASMREALEALSQVDAAIAAIPEVDRVVGKLGRADTALDPAPISMIETLVTYHPEYAPDEDGNMVRQWRDEIRSPQDIWDEIVRAAQRPGLSGAPVLMPISARIVMLQSGMRAPLGLKVQGPDLEGIEAFGVAIESVLREVPALRAETVLAERMVAKPYLEIRLDRSAMGRYGLSVAQLQAHLQVALAGRPLTQIIQGRERYPVAVRFMRERRDSLEALQDLPVSIDGQEHVPLSAVATLRYVRGPQVIKSEDALVTGYVFFDRKRNVSLQDAVRQARDAIEAKIGSGELLVPPGVHFEFAGSYQQQVRSEQRLMLLVPLAMLVVLMILYLQFRRISTCLMVFSSIAVALSGGLIVLWLYAQPWFLNIAPLGISLREVFGVRPVHLSVTVWVGFIALVGLATDDGVIMATYLKQSFAQGHTADRQEIRARVIRAGQRRLRPCLMTTATTVLALLPVVSSKGRGAELMMAMALPCVGGMAVELLTLFVVPLLYAKVQESRAGLG